MKAGLLPNLEKLRASGGFSSLGTSSRRRVPSPGPTSSTGRGPARTGSSTSSIDTRNSNAPPFFSAAETVAGRGGLGGGRPPASARLLAVQSQAAGDRAAPAGHPVLGLPGRRGNPLDVLTTCPRTTRPAPRTTATTAASAAWVLPTCWGRTALTSISPRTPRPSRSRRGAENGRKLTFEAETAKARLVGPENSLLKKPEPITIEFLSPPRPRRERRGARDPGPADRLEARPVEPLDEARLRAFGPRLRADRRVPAASAGSISRRSHRTSASTSRRSTWTRPPPPEDVGAEHRSSRTSPGSSGLFYTTGFQEDHKARSNGDFLRRRVRPAGGDRPRRTARAVRLRRRQLRRRPAVLLLLQQRPPVAHASGGTRTTSTRPVPGPRRKAASATSGGSIRSSTP